MIEIPWTVVAVVITALITGLFTRATQQRTTQSAETIQEMRQPAENTDPLIALTDKYLTLFDKFIALQQTKSDQSAEQTVNQGVAQRTIAGQSVTIAEQATTIVGLIADKDGMPTRIAEQVAALLLKSGYILEQRAALTAAGVLPEDQPIEPPDVPLTPLQPKNLLEKLAHEKAGTSPTQSEKLVEAGEKLIEAGKPPDTDKLAGIPGSD